MILLVPELSRTLRNLRSLAATELKLPRSTRYWARGAEPMQPPMWRTWALYIRLGQIKVDVPLRAKRRAVKEGSTPSLRSCVLQIHMKAVSVQREAPGLG